MEVAQHTHWLAGQPLASRAGWGPEVHAGCAPWESLGAWPQAGEEELLAALEVLAGAALAWSQRAASERQTEVARWIKRVARRAAPCASLARRIGFEAASSWQAPLDLPALARELDRELAWPRTARGPVSVLALDWSELYSGLLRAIGAALQAGRSVLVLADGRAPMLADQLQRELLDAGLPGELLAVLHAVTPAGMERLAGDGRVGDLFASSAERHKLRAWRAFAERAGLAAPELRLLRARSAWVGQHDDVERCARRLLQAAFDPSTTLFGQAPGQVARVHCHESRFSALSTALLQGLQQSGLSERGLPLIDSNAQAAWSKRWSSGLDQGATLIAGGELLNQRGAPRDLRVLPTVLTNVEPHMQCARSDFPLPVLCLLRAGDKIS